MENTQYNKEMSLNQWVAMFKAIYFPTQNYNRSKIDIFTHLVKVFGGGSKYLFRSADTESARAYLARIFGWYCALATRLNIDIEDAVWKKYPNICPRCMESKCNCSTTPNEIDRVKLHQYSQSHINEKPQTLREWQAMFSTIYRGPSGATHIPPSRDRLALVFSRMAEELGEVAEALLLDPAIDQDVDFVLKNEMADLCAWIFGLANNLQFVDPNASGVMLADVSWNFYGEKCHRCHKLPCVCVRGSFGLELASRGAMGPSHWDDRTGLANPEGMKVHINTIEEQYKKDFFDWSIVMIDIDNFKAVNTEHGSAIGDIVLKHTAEKILSQLSDNEIAFRRGGEEFVVVMEKSLGQAQIVAELIRRELDKSPVIVSSATHGNIPIKVTASFGVANTLNDRKSPANLEYIADERMREAKKGGKNVVCPALTKEQQNVVLGKAVRYLE